MKPVSKRDTLPQSTRVDQVPLSDIDGDWEGSNKAQIVASKVSTGIVVYRRRPRCTLTSTPSLHRTGRVNDDFLFGHPQPNAPELSTSFPIISSSLQFLHSSHVPFESPNLMKKAMLIKEILSSLYARRSKVQETGK
jgi:hypothetical protein